MANQRTGFDPAKEEYGVDAAIVEKLIRMHTATAVLGAVAEGMVTQAEKGRNPSLAVSLSAWAGSLYRMTWALEQLLTNLRLFANDVARADAVRQAERIVTLSI